MAIDVFKEQVVALADATNILPSQRKGKTLTVSVLYIWAQCGLRSNDRHVVVLLLRQ